VIYTLGKAKAKLERKRCSDGRENDDFDITTPSILRSYGNTRICNRGESDKENIVQRDRSR